MSKYDALVAFYSMETSMFYRLGHSQVLHCCPEIQQMGEMALVK